jgi:hypothetical protein
MRMSGVGVLYMDPGPRTAVHVGLGTHCIEALINVTLRASELVKNKGFFQYVGFVRLYAAVAILVS